mmetsp:Transcript_5277/g.15614  ORF Transcript_5277/g.15614 Transcript_5277/m.15614 type:complete len:242 (-) Transcript_5277:165-890(-)
MAVVVDRRVEVHHHVQEEDCIQQNAEDLVRLGSLPPVVGHVKGGHDHCNEDCRKHERPPCGPEPAVRMQDREPSAVPDHGVGSCDILGRLQGLLLGRHRRAPAGGLQPGLDPCFRLLDLQRLAQHHHAGTLRVPPSGNGLLDPIVTRRTGGIEHDMPSFWTPALLLRVHVRLALDGAVRERLLRAPRLLAVALRPEPLLGQLAPKRLELRVHVLPHVRPQHRELSAHLHPQEGGKVCVHVW